MCKKFCRTSFASIHSSTAVFMRWWYVADIALFPLCWAHISAPRLRVWRLPDPCRMKTSSALRPYDWSRPCRSSFIRTNENLGLPHQDLKTNLTRAIPFVQKSTTLPKKWGVLHYFYGLLFQVFGMLQKEIKEVFFYLRKRPSEVYLLDVCILFFFRSKGSKNWKFLCPPIKYQLTVVGLTLVPRHKGFNQVSSPPSLVQAFPKQDSFKSFKSAVTDEWVHVGHNHLHRRLPIIYSIAVWLRLSCSTLCRA